MRSDRDWADGLILIQSGRINRDNVFYQVKRGKAERRPFGQNRNVYAFRPFGTHSKRGQVLLYNNMSMQDLTLTTWDFHPDAQQSCLVTVIPHNLIHLA